jgi:hypothetical protein
MREREGGRAAVRSSSIQVRERDGRRWRLGRCSMKVMTPGSQTVWAQLSATVESDKRSEREATGRIGQAKQAGLTDRAGPPVSEVEATRQLGRTGREDMGHDWAGKEERRLGRNHFYQIE